MTPEKAVKILTPGGCSEQEGIKEQIEALTMGAQAIELVMIAKKPDCSYGETFCPECGEKLFRHFNHCRECGQLIDWGDTERKEGRQ